MGVQNHMNIDKSRWVDAARSFESSLMILRKDKNGWVIGFSVHPDDAPTDLLDAPLGTRFRAVLFQIDDDEQPVVKPAPVTKEGTGPTEFNEYVARAGKLCRDSKFQKFLLGDDWKDGEDNEPNTVSTLHELLGIDSRRDIGRYVGATDAFKELMVQYNSLGLEKTGLFLEES